MAGPLPLQANSPLLESVRNNKELAISICERLKQFNAEGKSVRSKEVVDWVASSQGLDRMNAEVFMYYVIGLECSGVR